MRSSLYIILFISLNTFAVTCAKATNVDSLISVSNDPSIHDSLKCSALDNLRLYFLNSGNLDSSNYYADLLLDVGTSLPNEVGFHRWSLYGRAYNYFVSGDYRQAINYYNKNIKLVLSINNKKAKKGLIDTYFNAGLALLRMGIYDTAETYYKESMKYAIEFDQPIMIAQCYNQLAVIRDDQGDLTGALDNYLAGLKIMEEEGSKYDQSVFLLNIGTIHDQLGDSVTAMTSFQESLKLKYEIGDSVGAGIALMNISDMLISSGRIEESIAAAQEALASIRVVGNQRLEATAMLMIGKGCRLNNQLEDAQAYLDTTITSFEALGALDKLAPAYEQLGLVFIQKGDFKTALAKCKKALQIAEKQSNPRQRRKGCNCLSKAYSGVGQYERAYYYLTEFYRLRDSLKNDDIAREVTKKTMQFEFDKEHIADSLKHEKEQAVQKAEYQAQLNEERAQQYILWGGLGGLFILGGILTRGYLRKRKDNKVIASQKEQVEKQKEIAEEQRAVVEEKNKEILDSITYAKRIQSAILPPSRLVKEYLANSFILYKPKDIVAGDFYWMEPFQGEKQNESGILFAAADCTGHGVPGAMVSVVCNNGLNRSVREYGLTDPGTILDKTRELVISEFEKSEEEVKDGMDIALCSLSFALSRKQKQSESGSSESIESDAPTRADSDYSALLQYAGAHNPLWIIRKSMDNPTVISTAAEKSISSSEYDLYEIKADKQPIGKFDNPIPYATHTIKLFEGDTFYIFSDGYADQFGGDKGKKLKAKNFKQLLLSIQSESMERQRELINEAFENWKGDFEQLDDVCVIGVRV